MRDQQLSREDQRKVSDALAKCAAATKAIEDKDRLADEAYKIFKEELGDNPRLVKVACRVYNSCKSIHKLSVAGDDNRGDSFSILDANQMADRLSADCARDMRKRASAAVTFTKVDKLATDSSESLLKVASASPEKTVDKNYFEIDRSGMIGQVRSYVNEVAQDCEDLIRKTASSVRIAERNFCEAVERFITTMATQPSSVRKEAAAQIYSNSKNLAVALINCFNEERPMQKVASADFCDKYRGSARVTEQTISGSWELVKQANDELADARAVQEITLSQIAAEAAGLFELVKEAAGVGTVVGLTAVANSAKELPDALGLGEETADKIRRKVYTNKVINRQLQHSAERMFINLIQDDNIAKYPMPDIVKAYNQALAKLPINMRLTPVTAHAALIKSDVISNLAEGGVASKADSDKIVNILGAYNRLRSVDGVVEGNRAI